MAAIAVFIGAFLVTMPCLLLFRCAWSCWQCCMVERHKAGAAAFTLFHHWRDNPRRAKDLPSKLRGVFWMATNAAPELLICAMGGTFDPAARTLVTHLGRAYNWTYSSGWKGWLEYVAVTFLSLGTTIVWEWDETYEFANMPLCIFGCLRSPNLFTIRQADAAGDTWDRVTYKLDGETVLDIYTVRKVIDAEGNRLPAFDDMEASVREGWKIKDTTVKTEVQLVQGDRCCRCGKKAQVLPTQVLPPTHHDA